jgi:hypothetical protein
VLSAPFTHPLLSCEDAPMIDLNAVPLSVKVELDTP